MQIIHPKKLHDFEQEISQMIERSYCPSCPPELREAEQKYYRAQCYVRCLEANLERITPNEFEPLMAVLEDAQLELEATLRQILFLRVHNVCQAPSKE